MTTAAPSHKNNKCQKCCQLFVTVCSVVMLLITGCSSDSTADADDQKLSPTAISSEYSRRRPARVLRLDSYHATYSWSQEVATGVERGLAAAGYSVTDGNVIIDQFYMDTKRNVSMEEQLAIAQETIAYIRETQPDVVIANDDNAIQLVVQPLLDEEITFVYTGLNVDPATYGLTARANVTGVLEQTYAEETFSWIERVFPEATQVTLIFDNSVSTQTHLPTIEAALARSRFANSPIYLTDSFEEWQTRVTAASEDSQVLLVGLYQTLQNASGVRIEDTDVMNWTVENSSIPIVPLWEYSVPQGALGGAVISGEVQGYEAGLLAAEVLNGTLPGSLPVVVPRRGKLVINRLAMQRWDVEVPLDLLEISEVY